MKINRRYVECSCGSPEHTLKFELDYNEPYEIYVSVYLNPYYNIFQRMWVALKYVFGTKQYSGHFDTTLIDNDSLDELSSLLQDYKKLNVAFMEKDKGLTPLTDEEVYRALNRVVALRS